MGIETHESGVTITGDDIGRYRQMVLHSVLKLEDIHGMRRSRGPSAYSVIKKTYGFKGNKKRVLEQFEELLREEK